MFNGSQVLLFILDVVLRYRREFHIYDDKMQRRLKATCPLFLLRSRPPVYAHVDQRRVLQQRYDPWSR